MGVSNSLPPKPEPGIRPYLWSLDMLTVVQMSKYEMVLSDAQSVHGESAVKAQIHQARDHFRSTLVNTLNVKIHLDDLVVLEESNYNLFLGSRYTIRWQPTTKNVQFRAGPGEGWIGHVGDLGVTCDVPVGQHQAAFPDFQNPFGTIEVIPYRMAGWNELERCWVFMPEGTLF